MREYADDILIYHTLMLTLRKNERFKTHFEVLINEKKTQYYKYEMTKVGDMTENIYTLRRKKKTPILSVTVQ